MENRHTIVNSKDTVLPSCKSVPTLGDSKDGLLSTPCLKNLPRMQGYLFKRTSNAFKTWNRRWFYLYDNRLVYRWVFSCLLFVTLQLEGWLSGTWTMVRVFEINVICTVFVYKVILIMLAFFYRVYILKAYILILIDLSCLFKIYKCKWWNICFNNMKVLYEYNVLHKTIIMCFPQAAFYDETVPM